MAAITESAFQPALLQQAAEARKRAGDTPPPTGTQRNTPQALAESLAAFRKDGTLPDYPLGSDFTAVEQRLLKALGWLKENTATRGAKLRTVIAALGRGGAADDRDGQAALQRMDLQAPGTLADRLQARLLRLALRRTNTG